MTEVDDNVEHYADLFLGHARQASGDGQCVGLLSQTLGDGPSHTFSSLLMQKSSLRDSYIAGLEAGVRLCSKLGTWCGMLELAGLATVFGRPVRSGLPNKVSLRLPYFHECYILSSSASATRTAVGTNPRNNHVVLHDNVGGKLTQSKPFCALGHPNDGLNWNQRKVNDRVLC